MDAAVDDQLDIDKLSIEDRLQHKNWKARVSGYEALVKAFKTSISEDEPVFTPYIRDPSPLRGAILDSNAVAQEKGIEAATAFIEFGGNKAALSAREAFTSAIIDKNVFGSSRAGTKKNAIELCLMLVECEDSADGVLEACVAGLKSKQPKAVAGAVSAMKEIVAQFGAKAISVKPILKVIATIFAHADKTVRAEGTALVQELHKWLGPALDASLADLKPVQLKELQESFAGEAKPMQTRFTRSQQRERALKQAEATLTGGSGAGHADSVQSGATEGDEDTAADAVDAYDLADPQRVLQALPEAFYQNLASAKWKDRKELALDPFLAHLRKTPRIQDDNYDELVQALSGRMTDANIACVISAANCIECLAKGLRSSFARHRPVAMPLIFERCKERKQSVIDALAAALDAIFLSASFTDMNEDIVNFSKHKNPQVKEQVYRFLLRSLQTTRTPPSLKTDIKPLSDCLVQGMEDSFEPVRNAAAEALGTMVKMMGERPMTATMERLDDIKKAKVNAFAQTATVRCSGTSVPAAAAPARKAAPAAAAPRIAATAPKPAALPPRLTSSSDKENSPPQAATSKSQGDNNFDGPATPKARVGSILKSIRAAPASSAGAGPASSAAAPSGPPARLAAAASKPAVSSGKAAPVANKAKAIEPLKYKFTPEDADAHIPMTFPADLIAELGDGNWKTRLAAVERLQSWLATEASCESELVVRLLAKKPGWKESNFQVYGKIMGLCESLSQSSDTWTKAASALSIAAFSDKLGDIKLKKPAGDALTAFAERFSLQFVLSQAYDAMTKQKAPKAQADALLWVEQSLRDFGIQGVAVRDLIDFLKNALKSTNAAVRSAATKTLVTLRIFVGPSIRSFVEDLNPALLSTIDSEFERVASENAPIPTRQSGDNLSSQTSAGAGASSSAGSGNADSALDELFPRQDIEKLVSSAAMSGSTDANWKIRKETLESVQAILDANKRLKGNPTSILSSLKARLADNNLVVRGLALDIVSRLAGGMNQPFEKYARIVVGPVASVLSDAKAGIRSNATATLSAISSNCGFDCMASSIGASLEVQNPLQRKELLTWLAAALAESPPKADLSPLTVSVIACLEDRAADVRKAAQELLPVIGPSIGFNRLLDHATTLKPASRSAVIPLIESAKAAAPQSSEATQMCRSGSAAAGSQPAQVLSASKGLAAESSRPDSRLGMPRAGSALARPLRTTGPASSAAPHTSAAAKPAAVAALGRATPQKSSRTIAAASPRPSQPKSVETFRVVPYHSADERAKRHRESMETGHLKWQIEQVARPDQIRYLQDQVSSAMDAEVANLLFSKSAHHDRDHLEGLAIFHDAYTFANSSDGSYAGPAFGIDAASMQSRLIANSDLTFKYLSIRLTDAAPAPISKALDVLELAINLTLQRDEHLSDFEATCFMSSLLIRLGDAKEHTRSRVKALLRSIGSIYPSSKLFSAILEEASKSRIARCRSEALEELGTLLQRQGTSVCQPSKAFPAIAACVADKDAATRMAALSTLSHAYTLIGDDLLAYVGALGDRERTMLDERLKRTPASPRGQQITQSSRSTPLKRAAPPSSSQARSTEPHAQPLLASKTSIPSRLPSMSAAAGLKRRVSSIPSLSGPSAPSTSRLPVNGDASPQAAPRRPSKSRFAGILSDDIEESVLALKSIQQDLASDTSKLAGHIDEVITTLTQSIKTAFGQLSADSSQELLRLCKHQMQTLSSLYDRRELSVQTSKPVLAALLQELTYCLVDTAENATQSDAIASLSKVLNMILIRIFHNASRTLCYGALLEVLLDLCADMRDLKPDIAAARARHAELVMKCLWKVSKSTTVNLQDGSLDAKHLLLDIDTFLQAVPPAEWRRRATDNIALGDMPLRTVKTILQQVVNTFGDDVIDELALIPNRENSFVYQYLYRLLSNSRFGDTAISAALSRQGSTTSTASSLMNRQTSNLASASPRLQRAPSSNSRPATPPQSPPSNDVEINHALKDIFDMIGVASESKKGISALHEFQKAHPDAEARINTWISATGTHFQSYIRRALSNLAAEDAARNTQLPASPAPTTINAFGNGTRVGSGTSGLALRSATNSPRVSALLERPSSRSASGSSSAAGGPVDQARLHNLKQMFGSAG